MSLYINISGFYGYLMYKILKMMSSKIITIIIVIIRFNDFKTCCNNYPQNNTEIYAMILTGDAGFMRNCYTVMLFF